ncbi:hypothetical protein [Micromonospora sp. C28ISP2-4]|uniref:hypothetical protein n=1 Tax=Micromonospora sp. C28ISP2-4 TaxID=3059523 RepID=UPI002675E10D|nr:hypothetical protein [Micromonospora sp. C28ISP2-4]MDO3686941.1 hypothetical protein [Micromonospora sp. C28ISP2-4]
MGLRTRTGAVGLVARAGGPGIARVRVDGTVLLGTARVESRAVGGRHRVPGRYLPIHGRAVPLVGPVRVGFRPGARLDDGPLALVRAGPVGRRTLPTLVGARPHRGSGLRVDRTVSLCAVPLGLALLRGSTVLGCPALGVRVRGGLAARRAVVPPATCRFAPVRRWAWAGLPPAVTAGFTPSVVARPAPAGITPAGLAPARFPPSRVAPAGRAPFHRRHGVVAPVDAGAAPATAGIVR